MVLLNLAALAAAFVPLVSAVNITVEAEGGNATTPHQYGYLHEVREPDPVNRPPPLYEELD